MPSLQKKTTKTDYSDQAEQIQQMQQTIQDLQGKIALLEKRDDVRKNLTGEKMRELAINPQNIKEKLKTSGHPPEIQAQIFKKAN